MGYFRRRVIGNVGKFRVYGEEVVERQEQLWSFRNDFRVERQYVGCFYGQEGLFVLNDVFNRLIMRISEVFRLNLVLDRGSLFLIVYSVVGGYFQFGG